MKSTKNSELESIGNVSMSEESVCGNKESVSKTNKEIKKLIKQVENVVDAEKNLSEKRRKLSKTLLQFNIAMDEKLDNIEVITGSLKEFGKFMSEVEDERERIFENASESFIKPLKILKGDLAMSMDINKKLESKTKVHSNEINSMANEQSDEGEVERKKRCVISGNQNHTQYNLRIRDRKNLEFIEFIESLMNSWLTFYHLAHDRAEDLKPYLVDLRIKMQQKWEHLSIYDPGITDKQQVDYQAEVKSNSDEKAGTMKILRSNSDASEFKRNKLRMSLPVRKSTFLVRNNSFQSLINPFNSNRTVEVKTYLDSNGIHFISKCTMAIEKRGLRSIGLYRVSGVTSKVIKLLKLGLDKQNSELINLNDTVEWQTNTMTSAVKKFFRNLHEPILPISLYPALMASSQLSSVDEKVKEMGRLINQLPCKNRQMLKLLLNHLAKVAQSSDENQMTPKNLGICFGPALLRMEVEDGNMVMENRLANVVVQTMIQNSEQIFQISNLE